MSNFGARCSEGCQLRARPGYGETPFFMTV